LVLHSRQTVRRPREDRINRVSPANASMASHQIALTRSSRPFSGLFDEVEP
jgi:hypothetical protein